jgi:outer membrane lipoprotein carrier protein
MLVDIIGLLFTAQLGSASVAPTSAPVPPITTIAKLSANDVVDHIQKFYGGINGVTAVFRELVHNATFGQDKESNGQLWLQKPGKMRWDYLEKKTGGTYVKKTFVSNGQTLFLIEHDNKQVITKSLQQDLMPVVVSFLYGKGDLTTEFDAQLDTKSSYGQKSDYVLRLTPKKSSAQYKILYLVADPTQFRVKESIIIDSSNNVNHFQFFGPDFGKSIPATTFEFDRKSVPGYRFVDADAPKPGASITDTPKTDVPKPATKK